MNKIICEICGTVYPDNAEACPICGYPRPAEQTEPAAGESPEKVRGGKFSNHNVKKRQRAEEEVQPEPQEEAAQQPRSDRGLKITAIILLICVLLVGAYIILRFVIGADAYNKATQPTQPSTSQTQPTETEPVDTAVLCTDLTVEGIDYAQGVEFRGVSRAWRMNVTTEPANTTDAITVTSSDENVVQVSENNGHLELVSVGPGTATITVTCGSVSKSFDAVCDFEGTQPTGTEPSEETTEPTEETTKPTETLPNIELKLNRTDFSMFYRGDQWQLYDGDIPREHITWTSSNPNVATVEDGLVKPVGPGHTVITATYNGQEVKCDVYCQF